MNPDSTLRVRPETPDDIRAITAVHDAAFGQPGEGLLVEELRMADEFDPALSLAAESPEGTIVGQSLKLHF